MATDDDLLTLKYHKHLPLSKIYNICKAGVNSHLRIELQKYINRTKSIILSLNAILYSIDDGLLKFKEFNCNIRIDMYGFRKIIHQCDSIKNLNNIIKNSTHIKELDIGSVYFISEDISSLISNISENTSLIRLRYNCLYKMSQIDVMNMFINHKTLQTLILTCWKSDDIPLYTNSIKYTNKIIILDYHKDITIKSPHYNYYTPYIHTVLYNRSLSLAGRLIWSNMLDISGLNVELCPTSKRNMLDISGLNVELCPTSKRNSSNKIFEYLCCNAPMWLVMQVCHLLKN